MQRVFSGLFLLCMLTCTALLLSANAQVPPLDFHFTASVGGLEPGSDNRILTIDSAGHAAFTIYNLKSNPIVQAESSFTINSAGLQKLWKALQDNTFGSLDSLYADTSFVDGAFAIIRVKASGVVRQVVLRNAAQPNAQAILDSLNAVTPPSLQLHYAPPELFNFVPQDPCAPGGGLMKTGGNGDVIEGFFNQSKSRIGLPEPASITAVEPVHPGSVVAYSLPFAELVKRGKVKLSSKGQFYGDAVSISVDNTTPQRGSSLDINLYLEFWGPQATPENVANIINDIMSKWSGKTTSDGTPVTMNINPIVRPDAVAPPGTPGYHQIKLVSRGTDGAQRSYVHGMNDDFSVNEGVGTGQWLVDGIPGTYAHEVGHLLGLEDQYDDYVKQPDGSWYSKSADTKLSDNETLANLIMSREPPQSRSELLKFLETSPLYSVTKKDHTNDLMADKSGSVRKDDIDLLAAQAGLLVKIRPGDVLVNRNSSNQNLVVTHGDDMFVRSGQRRTLNGLYGACIDFHSDPPGTGDLFDLAPPLTSWNGSVAATRLAALATLVDSTGLYCGDQYNAQAAIWRITDNVAFGDLADGLLLQAGIQMGDQALEFPRLTGSTPADSVARLVVPDELFIASIQPRFAEGKIGSKTSFKGSVAKPSVDGYSTSFSWTATAPDNSPVTLTEISDSASIIPDRTGIYEVGLRVAVTDSSQGLRTIDPVRKSYVVVPDEFTETFEHANLSDRLPWRTYGNAPWSVSTNSAQTGALSAQSGALVGNQADTIFSALEILVSLPHDTVITFAVRTATAFVLDRFEWRVDGNPVSTIFGYNDWTIIRHPLEAGTHTLTWTAVQFTAIPSKIWVDNIFFPAHAVVSSAGENADVPVEFRLFQNYPNPFNPTTTIRYALPNSSHVSLTVFNTLGQQVAELVNGEVGAGYHDVSFDASGLSSGVYFYRIQVRSLNAITGGHSGGGAAEIVETRKLLLLR